MLRADMTTLIFLKALEAIESSTLKLARKDIRIFRLLPTVLYAAQATAITSIEFTFSLVVLAIAGAEQRQRSGEVPGQAQEGGKTYAVRS